MAVMTRSAYKRSSEVPVCLDAQTLVPKVTKDLKEITRTSNRMQTLRDVIMWMSVITVTSIVYANVLGN